MTPGQPVRHNDYPGFSRPESMRNQQLAVVFRGPEQHWLVPQMRNGPKALDSLCLVNADKVSVAVLPFCWKGACMSDRFQDYTDMEFLGLWVIATV